jgi:hypothetical protein
MLITNLELTFLQRIYGGKYSNHQKSRIIAESQLIETYKNIRIQFEQMFCIEHKASRYSPPKMEITFKKLTTYMEHEKAHVFTPNRGSTYDIPEVMDKGMVMLLNQRSQPDTDLHIETESRHGDSNKWEDLGDEQEEVEDDGSLDLL